MGEGPTEVAQALACDSPSARTSRFPPRISHPCVILERSEESRIFPPLPALDSKSVARAAVPAILALRPRIIPERS